MNFVLDTNAVSETEKRFIRVPVQKGSFIELSRHERLPILYEDRSILAIDKPAGWMQVGKRGLKAPPPLAGRLPRSRARR